MSLRSSLCWSLWCVVPFVVACSGGEVPADGGAAPVGGNGGEPATSGGGGSDEGGAPVVGGGGSDPTGGNNLGGGGAAAWPDCEEQPLGSPIKTIGEIWTDNPSTPAEAWLEGLYVTAVSKSGCVAGEACQIYVQEEELYGSLIEAGHGSLRIGVAPSVAGYFTDIAVDDEINLYAHAVRDDRDGKNELIFLVTNALPGCAKVVGAGVTLPVTATLNDLTVAVYEDTLGPVLVEVSGVSGNPNLADETFALWTTGSPPGNDITTVTSLSPFFLPNAAFTGLTDGLSTDFDFVIGVFGVYAPTADPLIKYEEIYVRSVVDYELTP